MTLHKGRSRTRKNTKRRGGSDLSDNTDNSITSTENAAVVDQSEGEEPGFFSKTKNKIMSLFSSGGSRKKYCNLKHKHYSHEHCNNKHKHCSHHHCSHKHCTHKRMRKHSTHKRMRKHSTHKHK